ncbi:MFS transporter [Actinacidiphila sp. ITFR-21]|uniref:MFS transporter n=1 Tax=Actinacidiphila sp. ITFR-21 TaxID=3075199 RepID=UPI00288AFC3D|nr:MFS transporter [Streptomyces sp. ITFR-21]WNI15512.1 MFS transporter [Streptomyces sp. ITFR-21]
MAAPELGPGFRALWAANSVSTLGDGMVAAAAPLLVASVRDDPVLIGLAVFVQQLPWLLFSLPGGAVVDRLDKRRLVVAVDVARGLLTAVLALAVWSGHASIPVIYAVAFLLGTGETLAENAAAALVPAVVASGLLPRANARLHGSYFVLNKFAGRPAGASLFVLAAALPFGLDAASFLVSALLVAATRGIGDTGPRAAPGSGRPIRADITEGVRWLWGDPVIRMLAVALCLMNVTLTAGFSVMVLYARDRLGMSAVGYGFLLSASAVGGVAGALLAPRLQSWFRVPVLLRAGLVVETLTHVGLALSTTAWAACPVLVAFGVHSSVFAGVETTFRQRRVPEELRGRVQSVFMTFAMGGNVLGALTGGPLAGWRGVTAPFWCSAAAMAAVTALSWRPFGRNLAPGAARRPAAGPGAYSAPGA